MQLPKLDDLKGKQYDVYAHPFEQPLFVVGPPGSGKTTLAVIRAARLVDDTDKSVMLVTRNRLLAALAKQLSGGKINTNTMSSFFTSDFAARFPGAQPLGFTGYNYDWNDSIAKYERAGVVAKLDYLLVDEAQNLPEGFFRWAVRFGGKVVTVFADEDQTTDAKRSSLAEIQRAGLPEPIRLTMNYRNTLQIAEVAEHFHRSAKLPPGIVPAQRAGDAPRLERVAGFDDLADLVARSYRNRAGFIGVIVRLKDEVNIEVDSLRRRLPGVRVEGYTSDEPGASLHIQTQQPGVTVMTSEAVIGLEFYSVFLQDLSALPGDTLETCRRMYMLCARARQTLTLVDGPVRLTNAQLAGLPPPPLLER